MPDALFPTLMISSPALLAAGVAMALAAAAVAIVRRIALPRAAAILMLVGLTSLCLGAGGVTWMRRHVGHLAVVVDVSPSTRSATYHDHRELERRLEQLLGRTPYTLYLLTDGVKRAESQSPKDVSFHQDCQETRYAPPAEADAVVLFTDARFSPPNTVGAPPTYVVRDSALDRPQDAAIERLDVRGDTVTATVFNSAGERRITLSGIGVKGVNVPEGRSVVTGTISPDTREVNPYFIDARDRWNANDALRVRIPPRRTAQKWWIGERPPPPSGQWVHLLPRDVPIDLADYLEAGVLVLDDVSPDVLAETPRWRLAEYVRQLGGGLVILGGENAFAAGGYSGTTLEQLSPLSSTPPQPAAQWLILVDSSGSMARTLGDNTRWHFAVNAIGRLIPLLPAEDTVSVGNFSEALRWWIAGRSVRELQSGVAPPKDLRPHGPTNLGGALRLIADTTDATLPTELLLITDAEAKIDDVATLANALAAKNVRVSILAGDKVPDDNPLRAIADRTGGRIVSQPDPRRWAAVLKRLMRAASPPWLGREPITVRPTAAGPRFAPQEAVVWNRTWLKGDATELAEGVVAAGGAEQQRVPAIAAWNVGSGAVISAAFSPSPQFAELLAERVAAPPRDPRFKVTYDAARQIRVTLEAFDDQAAGGYINGLAPRVEVSADASRSNDAVRMTQTSPGRYEALLPAPRQASFVTVWLNGRAIDRFAVAGRYPPEFDKIGNDRAAMESLARATGGAVIDPAETSAIEFRWPTRPVALAPYLSAAGAIFISAGLVHWRWR